MMNRAGQVVQGGFLVLEALIAEHWSSLVGFRDKGSEALVRYPGEPYICSGWRLVGLELALLAQESDLSFRALCLHGTHDSVACERRL
jgi:hypothetical protein